MPARAKQRSNSNSYTSPDQTDSHRQVSGSPSPHGWDGNQSDQAAWLNRRLKAAEEDYAFSQLTTTGTIPITSRGFVAVFSPAHAEEHATGANRGSFRKPNMRMRENLTPYRNALAASSGATPPTHGGSPDTVSHHFHSQIAFALSRIHRRPR